MNKLYKTVEEQIQYLKDNKKIIVKDEHKQVFEERNYASLVNPYKEFFSYGRDNNRNHIYRNEVDFEEVLKIIKLDEEFCTMMYIYIGAFEKKFKCILFSEICKKYVECDNSEQDRECLVYVDEIREFLSCNDCEKLPRFCSNYPHILSKNGYVCDEYGLEKKKDLLRYIQEIGTGISENGERFIKRNKLIDHYLETQNRAPLWVIPNALTLGELNILFSMLDSEAQKRIVAEFYKKEEPEKITIYRILSFSGLLELIRKIRNIVNHYEPIFPFLASEMKSAKRLENSKIYKVFSLLEDNFNCSSFSQMVCSTLDLEKNNFNSKYIKILNAMKEFINRKNKK